MNRRELFFGAVASALGAVAAKIGIKTPRSYGITFQDWSKPARDVDVVFNKPTNAAEISFHVGGDDGVWHELEGITSISDIEEA